MSTQVSLHERHAIVALARYAQWEHKTIAAAIGCSNGTVSKTLQRFNETGDVVDRERPGRPPLVDITNTNNNPISNIIKKRRTSTANMIKNQLEKDYNISVSLSTINRLRDQLNYKAVRFLRVPHLTPEQREKRFQYVLNCEGEDWEDIIFTDESMFEVENGHGMYYKHRHSPQKEHPTKQYPPKVMVWAGIWTTGRTKLHIVEGKMDSEEYCNILYHHLIENDEDEFKQVLQDGAKCHTSAKTMDFVNNFDLEIRQNPPHSPDLNPIEKVWGWMKGQQKKYDPKTREQLIDLLQELWNCIPQATIAAFIRHNTEVCQKIKEANGGNI
jgi:transposase